MAHKSWIGGDLDGTLARYDGWKGPEHIGEPIPEMLDRVKRWRREGRDVRIFTARVWEDGTEERAHEVRKAKLAIGVWCMRHLGESLPVTCEKDPYMIELWDDRVVVVEPNRGRPVTLSPSHLY